MVCLSAAMAVWQRSELDRADAAIAYGPWVIVWGDMCAPRANEWLQTAEYKRSQWLT